MQHHHTHRLRIPIFLFFSRGRIFCIVCHSRRSQRLAFTVAAASMIIIRPRSQHGFFHVTPQTTTRQRLVCGGLRFRFFQALPTLHFETRLLCYGQLLFARCPTMCVESPCGVKKPESWRWAAASYGHCCEWHPSSVPRTDLLRAVVVVSYGFSSTWWCSCR